MSLSVVGRYRGAIALDVDTATVLDLKRAIARASGLPEEGLKLLSVAHIMVVQKKQPHAHSFADVTPLEQVKNITRWPPCILCALYTGGKQLKDEVSTLAKLGVTTGKTVMVLRKDLSEQVKAEEGLNRRTEEAAEAASKLSARAARDIGAGGRVNAWGAWGGQAGGDRGRGDSRQEVRPEIELTNQDGEAMAMPAEDSAALMEGIMLHRKGLSCVAHAGATPIARGAPKEAADPDTEGDDGHFRPPLTASASDTASGKISVEEAAAGHARAERDADPHASTVARTDAGVEEEKEGGPRGGDPAQRVGARRPTPSTAEKRLAQREALGLLLKAEEAFRRCDPKYLDCVDNYAYLCLDIVWLLFLMKDMSNLDLASRMLVSVERGFQKAHGPGLQRLTALKGEYCAEKLLYVRLHLLQGVVEFLKGNSGAASGLLIRASEEAKALKPNPALAARLMQKWHVMKFEKLRPKVALLALRAGRNDLDAAWQYLESSRQRQEIVREERKRRRQDKRNQRFGLTTSKQKFVDPALVEQLVDGGFQRRKVISALRKHDNNVEAALASLTSPRGRPPATGDRSEALAVLESLGVPAGAARDVLDRSGTLCSALQELGLDAPAGTPADASSTPREGAGASAGADVSEGSRKPSGVDGSEDSTDEDDGDGFEGGAEPTAGEMQLYEELAADRANQEEEGYLDVTLEDEADAADMYLHLCRGNIPVAFDFDKIRAGIAAAAAAASEDAATSDPGSPQR